MRRRLRNTALFRSSLPACPDHKPLIIHDLRLGEILRRHLVRILSRREETQLGAALIIPVEAVFTTRRYGSGTICSGRTLNWRVPRPVVMGTLSTNSSTAMPTR